VPECSDDEIERYVQDAQSDVLQLFEENIKLTQENANLRADTIVIVDAFTEKLRLELQLRIINTEIRKLTGLAE